MKLSARGRKEGLLNPLRNRSRLAIANGTVVDLTNRRDFRCGAGQKDLVRQQELIANTGWKTMTPIELFESNSQFHETLAKWSGNRFILQAVRRTDQLRRLVEYRQARSREPRQTQAKEHLEILDAIAAHDALKAASLMRAHLEGARRGKVYGGEAFVAPAPP